MPFLLYLSVLCGALFSPSVAAGSQSAVNAVGKSEQPGVISGRVLVDGKPKAGIGVVLFLGDTVNIVSKTTTDLKGRYSLTVVAPGRYRPDAYTPGLIRMKDSDPAILAGVPCRPIEMKPGKVVDGIDFELITGGTISGRVLGQDGLPVTAQELVAIPLSPDLPWPQGNTLVDLEGRFTVEGLGNGDYELWLICHVTGPKNHNVTQTVTITNGTAPFTIIPLDMNSN